MIGLNHLCLWLRTLGCGLSFVFYLLMGLSSLALAAEAEVGSEDKAPSMFEGEDGQFDVSGFLDQAYGFLPVMIPITEPAVGYGLAAGVMFISSPLGSATELKRPNITAVGGMRTENGTEGLFTGDIRYWMDGRLQTLVGYFDASVNLDFYGIGKNDVLADHPLRYNLDPRLAIGQAKYRLGDTRIWVGLGYAYADIDVSFDVSGDVPWLPPFDSNTKIAGLLPSVSYDTRDNVFTPVKGSYLELSGGWFGPNLGGDDEFQRLKLLGLHYRPLSSDWFLGLRLDGTASFQEPPFYLRPYISLRGVPAMRYQGDEVAQVEAELRWQLWNRFSVLGFAGVGKAWSQAESRFEGKGDDSEHVPAGGFGFRYEIARKYGIHVGMDFAFSEDEEAFYIQVGSAWSRP